MSFLKFGRQNSEIPTIPLVGVIIGLTLPILPLVAKITGWVLLFFAAACGVRIFLNRTSRTLPSTPIKVLLFAAGAGGIALTYGTAVGIEPGLSILVLLASLKMLEAKTSRDFLVLALLGFFLALCDLFFSQDFILWLYIAVIVVVLLASLVHLHRGQNDSRGRRRSIGLALTLLAQALPIVLLLFLFFPRTYGGFRFQFGQSLLGLAGMSDRLTPGSIASLALNEDVAFRADFPDGSVPARTALYWRGGVLWNGDGLTWTPGRIFAPDRRPEQLSGPAIRQRISLLPHGGRWIFALDRPMRSLDRHDGVVATLQTGGWLLSQRAVTSRVRYEVISRPENREIVLSNELRQEALRPLTHVSPRLQELVQSLKANGKNPHQIATAANRFFRTQDFVYTLEPGTYSLENGLDEFLFDRRKGFCEHYAAAYATLMRLCGVPARVIIGYHGGEYNSIGNYIMVRQSDAHAWCEVWFQGEGWERIDPTDMIAPERISSGLASLLQTRASQADPNAAQRSNASTGWREIQHDLQLLWDNINYQWDSRILNFDEEAQRNFLVNIGLGASSWLEIVFWMLALICLLLGILGLWLRRRRPVTDETQRSYQQFCQRMERAGLAREAWEGPQHFGARAVAHFAAHAAVIGDFIALYIRSRYGTGALSARELSLALGRIPRRLTTNEK